MWLTCMAIILLVVGCNTACAPELEADPAEADTSPPEVVEEEPAEDAWITWDTCSQIPGNHPCNFELMDQNGEMVELYDFHEKVIILDLSAMWCGVCNNIASKGDELVNDYGAENLIWITVLIDDATGEAPDLTDLQYWVTTYGINTPVLAGDRTMIDSTAQTGYPISSWPTLVVIDQNMVLRYGINGWSESMIRNWIESLVNGY